jgi:hypothetical protein
MKAKRLLVDVTESGHILTVHGWYLGKLADSLDYDQLGRKEEITSVLLPTIEQKKILDKMIGKGD